MNKEIEEKLKSGEKLSPKEVEFLNQQRSMIKKDMKIVVLEWPEL